MSFIINPYRFGFSCADADATAFIVAAGITDTTQKQAICTLVSDLKAYGLWNKMKAIYPFVGGTSSTHKWNLKDPRDLNAAFRLTFNGGGTHSATGYLPNGTNGFANTFCNQSVNTPISNNHISVYLRTNTAGTFYDCGITNNTTHSIMQFQIRTIANNLTYENGSQIVQGSNSDSRGMYIGTSTSSTSAKVFRNLGLFSTSSTPQTRSPFNNNIFLSASNWNNSGINYSNRELAFASIGDGLTDTEAANLYTAVQAYQTTLGRQV